MKRTDLIRLLAMSAVAALAAGPAHAQRTPSLCGSASVAQLHRDWILTWDKRPGNPPFDFRAKFAKYYDWDARDGHLYDDFDPQRRVARSPAEYGTFWTAPFTALRSAEHAVIDGPDVMSGTDDIAASTLEFVARLNAVDGKIIGIRTRSSLVWRCLGDGWKIVREHNSSQMISPAETDALLTKHR
jgi:ketosteroid isomerase-like protein